MVSSPGTIESITVEPLNIGLIEPFGIASGAQAIAANVLVTVELGDGTKGYGEAAPLPPFNGETQELAKRAIEQTHVLLVGKDARQWRPLAHEIGEAVVVEGKYIGSAQCALETAVIDALLRQANLSFWTFFGGMTDCLETDMTITTQPNIGWQDSIDHAYQSARQIMTRGIKRIKIKVGGGDFDLDVERVLAAQRGAPGASILLDGNAAFEAKVAQQFLKEIVKRGVNLILFEQPVKEDDWDGLTKLTADCLVPIAADESVKDVESALFAIRNRAVDVINIKLMKRGIAAAADIVALCRASGTRLMIGGMVESILAMTVSACFAAGNGGFEFVDLDTPMFMSGNPFSGGFRQSGDTLCVDHISAGHGTIPLLER